MFLLTGKADPAWRRRLLLLAGDVEINPGPRYICGQCEKGVGSGSVCCSGSCNMWFHARCIGISKSDLRKMSASHRWRCVNCISAISPQPNATLSSGQLLIPSDAPAPVMTQHDIDLAPVLTQYETCDSAQVLTKDTLNVSSDSPPVLTQYDIPMLCTSSSVDGTSQVRLSVCLFVRTFTAYLVRVYILLPEQSKQRLATLADRHHSAPLESWCKRRS